MFNKDSVTKNKYFSALPDFQQKKSQKFIGVVLTLIALSFFSVFAIIPTLSTIAKLHKQIEDNEFVYSQLEQKISNINKLKIQYKELENDLPFVLDALPQEANVSILTAQIQSIALDNRITIKKLQQLEAELVGKNKDNSKEYSSYSFSISGTGTYEDISKFVSTLSNMQRIVNIQIFNINKTEPQTNQSLVFNINGVAFFKD